MSVKKFDAVDRLIKLAQWHLDGMIRHSGELFRLTSALLTEKQAGLSYEGPLLHYLIIVR